MHKRYSLLLIIILTLLTYSGVLTHDFLSWDDNSLITNNYLVRNFSPAIFWNYDPELYIPITYLSFQIDYALAGLNATWFHFVNLFIHVLNAILVFVLTKKITSKKYLALPIALIFALHPINTEAVAWISARKELLSTLFFLLSFLSYIRFKEVGKKWLILSIIFYVLAMGAKVTAIVLPILLLAYDSLVLNPKSQIPNSQISSKIPKNKILNRFGPLNLGILESFWDLGFGIWDFTRKNIYYLVPALIFALLALAGKFDVIGELSFFQVILLTFASTTFYIQKLLIPLNYSAIYPAPDPIALSNPTIYLSIISIAIIALAIWKLRKNKAIVFGSLMFIVTLAPSFLAYMRGDGISIGADRYAYIPSIGFVIAFASMIAIINKPKKVAIALTVLAVCLIPITIRQNSVWANSEALFNNVLKNNPSSPSALNNVGNTHLGNGELDLARDLFEQALKIDPNFPDALASLGAVYGRTGDYDLAWEYSSKAIEANPNLPDAHFNLAGILFMKGDMGKAIEKYQDVIDIDPYYVPALWQMARAYLQSGDEDKARETYAKVLELDEGYRGKRGEMDELLRENR
ncbi:tetratricopeptide repeat protein [Patescibacteria group bacterium]|nr:tetratricopeptide repeat protein [Patescibacteria group bacterium]